MPQFSAGIRIGTRGDQPTLNARQGGTLYFVTDEGVAERWSGNEWVKVASDATVTEHGLLTDASVSGATTIDLANGSTHDLTLTGNATFTMSGAHAAGTTGWRLLIRQGGVGGWSITWGGDIAWLSGSAPVLQTEPGMVDVIELFTVDAGATYLGSHLGTFFTTPAPAYQFLLLSGPTVVVTDTTAVITWTVSEGATGQVSYGATSSYGSTSALEDSYTYNTHVQDITGLDAGTTYHFKVTSVNADSESVESADLTFTTTSTAVTIGPRYDEYTGSSGGTFPAFPTGANVVVAPTSILSASDKGLALGQWITAQADGAIMVLDSSGGGTAYGAGCEYVISDNVIIAPGSGVKKSNQTLWMYNTQIRSTNINGATTHGFSGKGAHILYFANGGHENLAILGGTLKGPNTAAGTFDCRSIGVEQGHGVIDLQLQEP